LSRIEQTSADRAGIARLTVMHLSSIIWSARIRQIRENPRPIRRSQAHHDNATQHDTTRHHQRHTLLPSRFTTTQTVPKSYAATTIA